MPIELADLTRLLGEWDELARGNGAGAGLAPAGQRLGTDDLAGSQLDDGLERWNQLIALQRPVELLFELQPTNRLV